MAITSKLRHRCGLAILAVSASMALAVACHTVPPPRASQEAAAGQPTTASTAEARRWVDRQLASMTLREKAAQMIMIRAYGQHQHPRSAVHRQLLDAVGKDRIGGIVVFDSDIGSLPPLLAELQDSAQIPLLVAADLERGAAFRIRRGTVPLPYAMAIGATGSEDLAETAGVITGREARALGIHWVFAPVADVNITPTNPVINVRSFGEDPEQVARLTAAFVRGARSAGVLTTAKHFPGHGDTTVDSHDALPTVAVDRERLDAVELKPFRAAIDAGVDAIMLGHLAVPALDASGTPASLSVPMVDGLLRGEMGFRGLVVTDAMEMKGVRADWPGLAVVQAVAAGADMVLLPPDHRLAIDALERAVADGTLPEARIEDAARRVLESKARLGLHHARKPRPTALREDIARPEDMAHAEAIARASITLVRNRGGILPLHAETPLRILHLTLTDGRSTSTASTVQAGLTARGISTERFRFGPEITDASIDLVIEAVGGASHILVSAVFSATSSGLSASQRALLDRLDDAPAPLIVLSLDSPYVLTALPDVPVYLCTYGSVEMGQRAAVAGLFGEADIDGTLPVSLPGHHSRGHGIVLPRWSMTLATPEAGKPSKGAFDALDRMLDEYVAQRAFPGGVVAIGQGGDLLHLRPFGRLSYAPNAQPVTQDTLYDLASLTKVVATTTMAMMLLDDERLTLDARVQSFLPHFTGADKDRVTLRHLLTHSAGVDWWAPLYETLSGADAYQNHVQGMDLVAVPGTTTRYSDLGLILLGAVLERAAGMSLDRFVEQRVFTPLGMTDTQFNPPKALLDRIAPTEVDAIWRQRLVHGEVHDENARALGGVAPHAGLFATAGDLARFAQMLINRGTFEHQRLISRETIALFTRRAGLVEGSDRALGWDTKSAEGSSAGSLFSPKSFGHTGFTGTSMWIDPERDMFVILLTNRVHPTRENRLIRAVRPAVADAAVRAVEGL